ncbi:MAG: ROK family protein [Candidatus Abyssobacteria bacterium SURF_5]|uniref:ROK family protein n=1 Tax=Abyssobacteria bacterium (strain SURF_5) TaxID=2093360 RepID=A0A3A4NTP6_ABYX5|nr:MAG: ROK family protein [Candidatus Abyssubacteria bacterium SURF_5]
MKEKRIVALDVGGTKLAAAVFEGRQMLASGRRPTLVEGGPDEVFGRIAMLLYSLLDKTGTRAGDLLCIGAGCGGPLDSETGVIYSPPNLPAWDEYPLKQKLEAQFLAPAFVENDANAAALGEHYFGAGKGYRNIFYITASTGIGSGIILDGKLYRGTNYSAGEFGHIVLARNGPRCNCGGRGCLEALASGTAIARRAQREIRRNSESTLAEIIERGGRITAREVAAAARKGDRLASEIFSDAAEYLGLGITTVIHLLNPELVIIGGGLAQTGSQLFEPVRRVVSQRAQRRLADCAQIVPAQMGVNVGVYGALAVALERTGQAG